MALAGQTLAAGDAEDELVVVDDACSAGWVVVAVDDGTSDSAVAVLVVGLLHAGTVLEVVVLVGEAFFVVC